MKNLIRATVILLLAVGGLFSCKKSNSASTSQAIVMETGIYEGTLNDLQSGQNMAKFQVSVSKTVDNTYQITQVSNGPVPAIAMTDKNHNYPFVNFTIAPQTYQNQSFSGSGDVSGGYNALYNSTTNSLFFGIALSSNLNERIIFNGNKQ